MTERRPTIDPMPAVAVGCALRRGHAARRSGPGTGRYRQDLGDTFVVDSGDDRYLFTFSPTGVSSFYGLSEEQASKGVADWRMLRRKLPDEVFVGRGPFPTSCSDATTSPATWPTSTSHWTPRSPSWARRGRPTCSG